MESYVGITHIFALSYKQRFLFMTSCDKTEVMSKSSNIDLDYLCFKYSKCITFSDVFFLAPLAVVSIRQIKYIAKCASI